MRGWMRPMLVACCGTFIGVACAGDDQPAGQTGVDVARETGSTVRLVYGDHQDAFGDLTVPGVEPGDAGWPVVVLIHGGFWRDGFFLDLMEPLVPSLTERGFAVWNIEYRRVGDGGGYPETLLDVAAAVDHLARVDAEEPGLLDLGRVATVGHSAGGHLATWVASRTRLGADEPGAGPVVVPLLAVAQAGVMDLIDCAEQGVGGTACPDLLGGGPADVPDRYAAASPVELLPADASVLLVHGARDDIVPLRQSERYVAATEQLVGAEARLVVDDTAGHFEHLDPGHSVWTTVIDELTEALS